MNRRISILNMINGILIFYLFQFKDMFYYYGKATGNYNTYLRLNKGKIVENKVFKNITETVKLDFPIEIKNCRFIIKEQHSACIHVMHNEVIFHKNTIEFEGFPLRIKV